MNAEKSNNKAKKIAFLALFLTLAMILSYVEVLIPFSFGIPGIKLGLPNTLILLTMYLLGERDAFCVSIVRILLSSILFGSLPGFLYSLTGGMMSFLVMALLKKTGRYHVVTISVCGGVTHNFGQLLIASFLVANLKIFYYAPILLLAGFLTGGLIGGIAFELLFRLSRLFKNVPS